MTVVAPAGFLDLDQVCIVRCRYGFHDGPSSMEEAGRREGRYPPKDREEFFFFFFERGNFRVRVGNGRSCLVIAFEPAPPVFLGTPAGMYVAEGVWREPETRACST